MTAAILQFPVRRIDPKADAFIENGIHWAVEEVATSRRQRVLFEADELLRRAAEFNEYVRNCGSDEPLMTLMAQHCQRFPRSAGAGREQTRNLGSADVLGARPVPVGADGDAA